MKDDIALAKQIKEESEALVKGMEDKIDTLKGRIRELESLNTDHRLEIRKLKHYLKQQNDLDEFIQEEMSEFLPPSMGEKQDTKLSNKTQKRVQDLSQKLRVQLLQSQVNIKVIRLDLVRATIQHINSEDKRINDLKNMLQKAKEQLERERQEQEKKENSERPPESRPPSILKSRTPSNLQLRSNSNVSRKISLQRNPTKESLKSSTKIANVEEDSLLLQDIKTFQTEIRKIRKQLDQQMKEGEKDLVVKEKELADKENEVNINADPETKHQVYEDLVTKLKGKGT